MIRTDLIREIKEKESFLCVGLDSDIEKLPAHLKDKPNAQFLFNKAIIEATLPYCVAYKINTAFYESQGLAGWQAMEDTIALIPSSHLIIADAKRGDIGNTSDQYAKAFFTTLNCGAITVAPYMGYDSIEPFLRYKNKWTIVLGLTSNEGARDFQLTKSDSLFLYEEVIRKVSGWGTEEQLMFVIGASQAIEITNVRKMIPNHFLLIPGVGAQGGSLEDVYRFGKNSDVGLIINASRSIIFASNGEDFAQAAATEAQAMHLQMKTLMQNN